MKDQIDLSKMDSIYEIGPYGFPNALGIFE